CDGDRVPGRGDVVVVLHRVRAARLEHSAVERERAVSAVERREVVDPGACEAEADRALAGGEIGGGGGVPRAGRLAGGDGHLGGARGQLGDRGVGVVRDLERAVVLVVDVDRRQAGGTPVRGRAEDGKADRKQYGE